MQLLDEASADRVLGGQSTKAAPDRVLGQDHSWGDAASYSDAATQRGPAEAHERSCGQSRWALATLLIPGLVRDSSCSLSGGTNSISCEKARLVTFLGPSEPRSLFGLTSRELHRHGSKRRTCLHCATQVWRCARCGPPMSSRRWFSKEVSLEMGGRSLTDMCKNCTAAWSIVWKWSRLQLRCSCRIGSKSRTAAIREQLCSLMPGLKPVANSLIRVPSI